MQIFGDNVAKPAEQNSLMVINQVKKHSNTPLLLFSLFSHSSFPLPRTHPPSLAPPSQARAKVWVLNH